MIEHAENMLRALREHAGGQYPEDAFLFVREGLGFASNKLHGQETDTHQLLQRFLLSQGLDWRELGELYEDENLPREIVDAIEASGGIENLNRHVGGRELCWALREFAVERWGRLAPTVLDFWNIRGTSDFGKIVFAFIDLGLMQREDSDTLDDFESVYQFADAFDWKNNPSGRGSQSPSDQN